MIYKAPVTPAVAAAKQTYLGKVYLDWSKWPVVTDRGNVAAPGVDVTPERDWNTVEFQDLRFGYWPLGSERAGQPRVPPLSGWVYVGPGNEIEGMFMQGHEQKNP